MKEVCLKELSLIFLSFFISIDLINGSESRCMGKAYHGTLNIVAATPDVLMASTDSRATITGKDGQVVERQDIHQKLFPLPGNIIVTIAGYNRVDVPSAPEFTAPAAGIILDYIDELNSKKRSPSYDEALTTLIHLLTFNLTSVSNINAWTFGGVNKNNYTFHMIVAGKEDGKFIISKVILDLKLNGDSINGYYVTSELSNIVRKIVKSFTYITAGLDLIADRELRNIKGTPTKKEMDEFIQSAMRKTMDEYQGVGGAIQQALLTSAGILEVNIPSFPRPDGPKVKYNLFLGGGFSNSRIAVESSSPFLFIASSFNNTGVILDRNYFYGNHLNSCNIYTFTNLFSFDKTNKMVNCKLYIGKNVNKQSTKFRELFLRFSNKNIYYERQ